MRLSRIIDSQSAMSISIMTCRSFVDKFTSHSLYVKSIMLLNLDLCTFSCQRGWQEGERVVITKGLPRMPGSDAVLDVAGEPFIVTATGLISVIVWLNSLQVELTVEARGHSSAFGLKPSVSSLVFDTKRKSGMSMTCHKDGRYD